MMCNFRERLRNRELPKTTSLAVGRRSASPMGSVSSAPAAASCVDMTAVEVVVTAYLVMGIPRSLAGGVKPQMPARYRA